MGQKKVVGATIVQDLSLVSAAADGFLKRHRHRAKTLFSDGQRSDTYLVDFVDRQDGRRDAAVVMLTCPQTPVDQSLVLLRSQFRYPAFIAGHPDPLIEPVAGIIDAPETAQEAAIRETYEEAAIRITPEDIKPLGPPIFASPGTFTERLFFFYAKVDAAELKAALTRPLPGDGSPLEEGAELLLFRLGDALESTVSTRKNGPPLIYDTKTELGLFRLRRELSRCVSKE